MRQQVSKNNTTGSTITVHHHPTVPATRVSFMTKLTVLQPVLSRNPLW